MAEVEAGMLRVTKADEERWVGYTMHGLVHQFRYFGSHRWNAKDWQVKALSREDSEIFCRGHDEYSSLIESFGHPLPQDVRVSKELAEKYRGSILVIDPFQCGTPTFGLYLCSQFEQSIVVNARSTLAAFTWNDFRDTTFAFAAALPNCTVLTPDNLDADPEWVTALSRANGTLMATASLQVAVNPFGLAFDHQLVTLIFSVIPGLICVYISFVSARAFLFYHVQDGCSCFSSAKKWYIKAVLLINCITIGIFADFLFADGLGTKGNHDFNISLVARMMFTATKLGCKLAITVLWIDLSALSTAKRLKDFAKFRRALLIGLPFSTVVEVVIQICLFDPRWQDTVARSLPIMGFVCDLFVALFFMRYALVMLHDIKRSIREEVLAHLSKLFFVYGLVSLMNVTVLAFYSVYMRTISGLSPVLHLLCWGIILYCRLLEALLQTFICKPPNMRMLPFVSLVAKASKISAGTSVESSAVSK